MRFAVLACVILAVVSVAARPLAQEEEASVVVLDPCQACYDECDQKNNSFRRSCKRQCACTPKRPKRSADNEYFKYTISE